MFKAKQRNQLKISRKIPETTESHPLNESLLEKREVSQGTSKKNTSKQSVSKLTKTSFDPLSTNPLSEESFPEPTKTVIEDKYSEDWKKLRRDTLAKHDSSSNLAAISIIPGENSARHVSVKEFTDDLETKHAEMIASWKRDDKVEALKIVIQCLKSLSDNSAIEFYPSKVFLILDVLAAFVDLVDKRLEAMEVEMAKEVAKNWYYKIFSIR